MTNTELARSVIDQLEAWVQELATPFLPPRTVQEQDGTYRLLFQNHSPHAVLVGKLVRAVSGSRAALVLAGMGYVAESAVILRTISDFCGEVTAVAEAIRKDSPPAAVLTFVAQYFEPRARTPEELAARERAFYVSREELMKAEVRLAQDAGVDAEQLRTLRRFLNMSLDAYVHGAYETTMELFNPHAGRFMLAGHESLEKRHDFVDAVVGKLHGVVSAAELAAAVSGNDTVFSEARRARRALDSHEEAAVFNSEHQSIDDRIV